MTKSSERSPNLEVFDLALGLWIWRLQHPNWHEGADWQPVVTSICVDSGGERWVLDPLLPPNDATQVWEERLEERPPTAVATLIPDTARPIWSDPQTRSVDALVHRYGCCAFGPNAWDDAGGLRMRGGKDRPGSGATGWAAPVRGPIRLERNTGLERALVFGDSMTKRAGALRAWMSPTHEGRALPDLRPMLGLPFERVITSHGEPVHTRAEFERALELPPWPAGPLHQAAYGGNFDRVRSLIEAGADPNRRDELHDATPLDWAESASKHDLAAGRGHEQIIALLKSVMGDTPDAPE